MTKLYINDIEYPLDDGIIINDKKTEELNSAVVTVGFVDRLDINPLDNVRLMGDNVGEKHYVVNTWTNTTASFNPLRYTYNIALVSEAVKLQKIICPNLAITQPIGMPKTIKDKLMEYYEVFIEPQYPELTLSQELLNLTENTVSPEYLFSRPTMYEVFNSLLIKVGCCAEIINHQITYKRLDDYGVEIDTSKLHYENDTQNLNEYANRLDIEVENAISNDINYSTPSGISVRADGGSELTDDNMVIMLDKPIYDIKDKSLFVYLLLQPPDQPAGDLIIKKFDITDYIVEKSVYDTFLVTTQGGVIKEKGYKRNALYYVSGDNKIQGFTYQEKIGQTDTYTSLYNILLQLVPEKYAIGLTEGQMKEKLLFSVEYKTSDRFRLAVEKQTKNNATLVDNQGESQIDAETFGKVEQDKINRFGNKEIIITATYRNDEIVPELGDYIDEYVLAERELVYYDDFVLFKGYLYKHFVRKNLFYGLNSKKRFFQISDEYVMRNEYINYDLTFTSGPTEDYKYLARFVLQPLSNYGYTGEIYPEFAKYILFKFKDNDGKDIIEDGYILKTASTYACGKSNVLSVQMEDNFSAGLQVVDAGIFGKDLQKYVKYVDNYGEFKSYEVTIRTNVNKDLMDGGIGTEEDIDVYKPIADAFPYISDINAGTLRSNYITRETQTIYKDNREAFSLSVNFNFKDTEEVIIGDIAMFTGFVMDKAEDLRFFYSTRDYYELGDTTPLGQETTMIVSTAEAEDWYNNGKVANSLRLIATNINGTQGWKSYGITDKNGNLILGVNGINGNEPSTRLYLHINKKGY